MVSASFLAISYHVATTLILAGFAMLCQPFFKIMFSWGFPVLMVGVVVFMILDHIPPKPVSEQEA